MPGDLDAHRGSRPGLPTGAHQHPCRLTTALLPLLRVRRPGEGRQERSRRCQLVSSLGTAEAAVQTLAGMWGGRAGVRPEGPGWRVTGSREAQRGWSPRKQQRSFWLGPAPGPGTCLQSFPRISVEESLLPGRLLGLLGNPRWAGLAGMGPSEPCVPHASCTFPLGLPCPPPRPLPMQGHRTGSQGQG